MIEHFTVFDKGGVVLWSYTFTKLKTNAINDLISRVLLEERSGQQSFTDEKYTVKWTFANEYDLVFAAAYQTTLADAVRYADDLLEEVKAKFCSEYSSAISAGGKKFVALGAEIDFSERFDSLLKSVEEKSIAAANKKAPRSFWETKKGQELAKNRKDDGKSPPTKKKNPKSRGRNQDAGNDANDDDDDGSEDDEADTQDDTNAASEPSSESASESTSAGDDGSSSRGLTPEEIQRNLEKKFGAKKTGGKKTASPAGKSPEGPKKRVKEAAPSWNPNKKLSKEEMEALDFSDSKGGASEATAESFGFDPTKKAPLRLDDSDSEDDDDEDQSSSSQKDKKPAGGIMGLFRNFSILGKELTRDDVDPVLAQIKTHLITKNVASEIAEKLCDSVGTSLVGKQLGSFTLVSSAVREAMQQALTKILTPKRNIDILREIREAQSESRPYSVVFVGVNGVGKSTSLAKVCSWLQQQNLKVQITACDTFRSGAVEQLGVHARALGVPLFQQGYGKDSSAIAKQSIVKAKSDGIDVVLIDTAGRMQDNEPLMQALAKLIKVNSPDLILFVGEALVGNDSVDQLTKFNRALEEFGDSANPRLIDGIVLTKFDTVDDKVGAAISMVYTTGQPIMFIGVGQSYADIRTLNIKRIVSILLKGRA